MSTRVSRARAEESLAVCPSGEDHLSSLPECAISYILSLLPIKEAIRTCVLSKVWEYKWTSISNVDVAELLPYSSRRYKKLTTFPEFVDRILFLFQNVKSFRASCTQTEYYSTHVTSWITAALEKNVESLDVYCYPPKDAVLLLPHTLLHNTSLRRLRLWMSSIVVVPSKNCFPNLTSLELCDVEIRNMLSNTLILSFPVLESISLGDCQWSNVKFVVIRAPALTSFKSGIADEDRIDDYSIEILAPRLAMFESSGSLLENFILPRSVVVSAGFFNMDVTSGLQLLGKIGLRARRLLAGFSSLEDLTLSGSVAEAIVTSKQELVLPVFKKLERLVLHTYTRREALLEILHLAPFLKYLRIDVNFVIEFDYEALQYIPMCIASHLQEVEIYAYDGGSFTFPLAKFLLMNGVKLERFLISGTFEDMPKDEIVEQLYTFPRASTCLTIVANGRDSSPLVVYNQ